MHKWEWHQKCPVLASATLKDATQIEPIPSITFQFHFASKEGKILFNIKKKILDKQEPLWLGGRV
jgi:hypothetical protein